MLTHPVLRLQEAGFDASQVEAITSYFESSAATKADIAELRGELNLVKWMVGFSLIIGMATLAITYRLTQTLP